MLPPLISRMPIEEQLSRVYTIHIFRRFQCELYKCIGCTTKLIKMDASLFTYVVKQHNGYKYSSYEVFQNEDNEVKYTCYEFDLEVFISPMLCFKGKIFEEFHVSTLYEDERKILCTIIDSRLSLSKPSWRIQRNKIIHCKQNNFKSFLKWLKQVLYPRIFFRMFESYTRS